MSAFPPIATSIAFFSMSALGQNRTYRHSVKTSFKCHEQTVGILACRKTSASLAWSALSPSNMNLSFLGDLRTSLHMIDESPQLRHDLSATRVVKKHAWQHRRERFQDARESSRFHRCSGDRPRHLRKTQTLHGRAK